jgi:SAM-dependent methyltransferase
VLADRLDAALLALAAGRRRPLLELARDLPGVVAEMAGQFRMSPAAVASDLSMLHAAEFEDLAEALPGRYDPVLLARAGIGPESRVLDVGCGSGASTRAAARLAVAGTVLGIDVAPQLVKRARERAGAEGLANVEVVQGDATVHAFPAASFDVAISRFGAMYFGHPVPAFANIASALQPGGRLALLAWRALEHNEWMAAIGEALAGGRPLGERPEGDRGAFALADEATVRAILAEAGYEEVDVEAVDEPVVLGADAEQAYDFVSTLDLARAVLEGLDARVRRDVLARLRAVLDDHQTADGVLFGSGAWLVTARRPGGRVG